MKAADEGSHRLPKRLNYCFSFLARSTIRSISATYRHSYTSLPECILLYVRTCAQVSLRYLLGCFYVNFSPLWPPVAELVASYAVNEYKSVFWDVYTEVMDQVARNAGAYSWRGTTLGHCHVGVLSQCSRGIRHLFTCCLLYTSPSPRDS